MKIRIFLQIWIQLFFSVRIQIQYLKKLFNLLYLVKGFLKLKNKKKTAKNNRKNKITANF